MGVLSVLGGDFDGFAAVRASERGVCRFGALDEGFASFEWRVGNEFGGCGVECACDVVEFFEGDVSVEEVLDVLFGDSEDVCEVYLRESFFL